MDTSFFQHVKQISKFIVSILSWTLFLLLLIVIVFLCYYLIATNVYANRGEKYEPTISLYTIVSPSMEPNIKVYDVIINKKVEDYSTVKVGDVITFISTSNISNGMTVTHRVTSIVNGKTGIEFKTKGDNNLAEDTDTVKHGNLIGKVILKIPQLGRLQFFLSNKGGWLLIVIFPALYIIVKDLMKISKLNKAKKDVSSTEISENTEEKLKLEAFKKEEIKKRLNEKQLQKAYEIQKEIKNNNKNNNVNQKNKGKNNNTNNNKNKNNNSKNKNKNKQKNNKNYQNFDKNKKVNENNDVEENLNKSGFFNLPRLKKKDDQQD